MRARNTHTHTHNSGRGLRSAAAEERARGRWQTAAHSNSAHRRRPGCARMALTGAKDIYAVGVRTAPQGLDKYVDFVTARRPTGGRAARTHTHAHAREAQQVLGRKAARMVLIHIKFRTGRRKKCPALLDSSLHEGATRARARPHHTERRRAGVPPTHHHGHQAGGCRGKVSDAARRRRESTTRALMGGWRLLGLHRASARPARRGRLVGTPGAGTKKEQTQRASEILVDRDVIKECSVSKYSVIRHRRTRTHARTHARTRTRGGSTRDAKRQARVHEEGGGLRLIGVGCPQDSRVANIFAHHWPEHWREGSTREGTHTRGRAPESSPPRLLFLR